MAFSIKAFFGGDTTQLRASSEEAVGVIQGWANKTKSVLGEAGTSFLSAFSVFGIVQKIIGNVEEIRAHLKEITNLAREYETSTSVIQAFQAVVVKTGGTTEDATKAFSRARLAIDQLETGSKNMEKAFGALGLSAKDFIGLSLEDSLAKIAASYEDNKDKIGAYAAVAEIFGSRTIPHLQMALQELGEKGFTKLTEEQAKLNKVWNEDSVTSLNNFSKTAKSTYNFLETGVVDFSGHVVAGFRMIGNSVKVAFETSSIDLLTERQDLLIDKILAGSEKTHKAASVVKMDTEAQTESVQVQMRAYDKINESKEKDLALLAQSQAGNEKITTLKKLQAEYQMDMVESANDLEAAEKARQKIAELGLEISKNETKESKSAFTIDLDKLEADKKANDLAVQQLALQKQITEEKQAQVEAEKAARAEAGKAAAERINEEAFKQSLSETLGKPRGSKEFAYSSDASLQEIINRDKDEIFKIGQTFNQNISQIVSGNFSARTDQAKYALDASGAQKELDLRASVRGVDYTTALKQYKGDPLNFDAFYQMVNSSAQIGGQTNTKLDQITSLLKNTLSG